jgi:predicted ribosome quality control (RQC) complex YloA/Tae2 family protein
MKTFTFQSANHILHTYILGQNAHDNQAIIDNADKNDWWVHMNEQPSSHCIIETDIITIDDLKNATELIKSNTTCNKNMKNNFCYTQIKNLKKTKTKGRVKFITIPQTIIL